MLKIDKKPSKTKTKTKTKTPQLPELALLKRGIIRSLKAVTVILTGKMFSRTWI